MDGLDRRRLLGLFAGLGVTSLTGTVAGCGTTPTGQTAGPIRIGLLLPLSGPNKAIGEDIQNGFSLFLAQNGHALGGHPVEIITEEEGDTPAAGIASLNRLHEKAPLAVVGVSNAQILGSLRESAEKAQIPLIGTHASPVDMPSSIFVWRTGFVNDDPGRALGTYLKRRVSGRIGLVGMGAASGEILGGLTDTYGAGVQEQVVVAETATPTPAFFASAISQLAAKDPIAIFSALPTRYIVPFMAAMRANSKLSDKRLYAPGAVSEGVALGELGDGAIGLLTALPYSADLDNAVNHNFSASYQSTYLRTPSSFAVAAYDAAIVLDRGIALCGDGGLSGLQLNSEISNVGQIVSPRGNWQFNQERSPQQKWYLREVRRDGPVLSNVLISDLAMLS
jgi:branched-chain amino acid transport system substrate-binding protein